MYYSSNFGAFPMMPNQYHYNDFYMYNKNHAVLDLHDNKNAFYHHNPSFYYADGYRTIRVNNKFIGSQTLNRKMKTNNSRSDLCCNCINETCRRKNGTILDKSCHIKAINYKYCNTMPKNDKLEMVRVKTDTYSKSFRSRSINMIQEKKDDGYQCKPKTDETCQIKERLSRIDCFESEDKKNLTDEEETKEEEKKNVELKETSNLPPPPPPLPVDFNFLNINSNLTINRVNKIKNPSADANTTKSFDAVVDELKFRLNKIKPLHNNENLIQNIPRLILTERQVPDELNQKSNENKNGLDSLKEIDSGIQSTDTFNKRLKMNSDSSLSSISQSKQNSLNRLKNTSKSNIEFVGIFRKNKLNSEQKNSYNDSNINRLSEPVSKQSDSKTELSSLSDFTDSIKFETQNDSEEQYLKLKRSFTQNLNSKGKKVIFESIETCDDSEKNTKKILKRNTFSEIKKSNLKPFNKTKPDLINRLVKSKSEYINLNKSLLDRETQSSFDTFDLIKIESLGDLSHNQNSIAAFSTRNFFQNDKLKQDSPKIESSIKINREFKKNSNPIYSSSTLKSKSEIKMNKEKQKSITRPIAKSALDTFTLKPNKFKLNDNETEDINQTPSKNDFLNQIPSKYSSFVDLKKNKNQISHKRFNSLNRIDRADTFCKNLITKASEYGIKVPELLGNFRLNYQVQQEELNKNENNNHFEIFNGINDFNQFSRSDLDEQYNFEQYLDLMSSF